MGSVEVFLRGIYFSYPFNCFVTKASVQQSPTMAGDVGLYGLESAIMGEMHSF